MAFISLFDDAGGSCQLRGGRVTPSSATTTASPGSLTSASLQAPARHGRSSLILGWASGTERPGSCFELERVAVGRPFLLRAQSSAICESLLAVSLAHSDDVRIYYEAHGEGPALLLVSGIPG